MKVNNINIDGDNNDVIPIREGIKTINRMLVVDIEAVD
jgi:hypothetical protein